MFDSSLLKYILLIIIIIDILFILMDKLSPWGVEGSGFKGSSMWPGIGGEPGIDPPTLGFVGVCRRLPYLYQLNLLTHWCTLLSLCYWYWCCSKFFCSMIYWLPSLRESVAYKALHYLEVTHIKALCKVLAKHLVSVVKVKCLIFCATCPWFVVDLVLLTMSV